MNRAAVIGIAVAAVALVGVGAGVAVWASLQQKPGPESVASSYVSALAAGDAAAVGDLLAAGDDEEQLLAAFGGADSYLNAADPVDVAIDDDTAHASARAELDGAPVTLTFTLTRTPTGWQVTEEFAVMVSVVTPLGDSVGIGGELVAAGTDIPLLPAVYTVTTEPAAFLDGDARVAAAAEPVEVELDASVSGDAVPAAQEQLDAYAEECTADGTAVPANCGIRIPWAADLAELDTVAFAADTLPVVTIDDDGASFVASGGVVVATATGTTRDGAPGTFHYRTDDWTLRGDVDFTGESMVLSVR